MITGMLAAVIVGFFIYRIEHHSHAPVLRADTHQAPKKVRLVAARAPVGKSHAKPPIGMQFSAQEYAFLRQRYPARSPLAHGPLPAPGLRSLARVTKAGMGMGQNVWPAAKDALYGKTASLEAKLDTGLSADSAIVLGYPFNSKVSLLDLAIQAGQRGAIKVLLAHDADVNPSTLTLNGTLLPPNVHIGVEGPLAVAARYGEDDIVLELLRRGANVNQVHGVGGDNSSALAQTVTTGNVSTAYLLLTHGADVNSAFGPGGTVPSLFSHPVIPPGPSVTAMKELLVRYGFKQCPSQNDSGQPILARPGATCLTLQPSSAE
ncbi:MAG: ankyrin repeat domain-containing protein [Bryobacteraceae bacterium]